MRIDNNEIIGDRIAKFRKKEGLTQKELCEIINLSTTQLSNLECGRNNLSYPTFIQLCNTLNVCPCQLLSGAIKEDVDENIIDLIRELSIEERNTLYVLLLTYFNHKNL